MDPEAAQRLLGEIQQHSPEVVEEVESLLQAQSLGEDLFGSTLSMLKSPSPGDPELSPGQIILRYRLLQKVGAGGAGTVWKAEDAQLRPTASEPGVPGH